MDRIEVKATITVDDAGMIEGIAWPFGAPDRYGDEILPGAFKGAAGPLPMLAFHEQRDTVGVWDSITETAKGLIVKGRLLVGEVARATEMRALVREKAATGLSIGFRPKVSKARSGGGRTISKAELIEVSIVAVPAHPGARITSAKAAEAGKEGIMPEQEQVAAPEIAELEKKMGELAETVKGFKVPDLTEIEERLKKVETKANRPATGRDEEQGDPVERKALVNFLRAGVPGLDEADRKALSAGSGATGGYVTAPEYSRTIIEGITQYSPMRSLANVLSISSSKIYLPKLTTPLTGGWVTETGERTESQPVFDQDEIDVFEHAVIVPMSQQLTEDAFIDLPGYVSGMIGKRFGNQESLAFTKGDGDGKPTGFLDDPAIFEGVTAKQDVDSEADASAFLAKLIELFYLLPEEYAINGTWQMNRRLQGIIRKCADTTTKGTLWSDGLANGTPPSFLGRPVRENPFMDNLVDGNSPAGTTYPVAFGDWKSTYTIVDRVKIKIMNDPYTGADNGVWKLRARKRVGGKVTLAGAAVLLKAEPAE